MRVLIVDDEATSRIVLKAMVSRLGHECLVAEDGNEAWEILAAQDVDVLLSDWMMPGFDGPELCRRTRRERSDHYVYIVLVTSLDVREQVLEGMGAGADDYLVKPVDPFVLQTRLVAAERVTALHRQVSHFQDELERANRELLGRSLTDPLTGLGNRRRMEEDLAGVAERAARAGHSYGVAMFDIDHFKLYNDHYGHQAGDDVLGRVATVIRSATRSGELAYRYGGEEFLVLVPEGGRNEVVAAAERIRRAVADQGVPHGSRPTSPALVTVSGGVAAWTPDQPRPVTETLRAADEALFAAKSAGRNRICEEQPQLAASGS
ncbi:MAG TPA: diguanylate cyclase [Acidimicrobiales bacterium]|jgi:two-component system chemotaxis response regulator CheY|nr:diguanylate cyclase [Acidimicrobiales bacterium]